MEFPFQNITLAELSRKMSLLHQYFYNASYNQLRIYRENPQRFLP